jgi:hypothetical protein
MAFSPNAETVFADGPSASPRQPPKEEIRALLKQYETIIAAFTSNGGLIYTSIASLNADLAHDAKSSAWVVGDAVAENNGIYQKQGASGAGSWLRVADLPYSFIIASDAGAGTPNAIQATSAIPISGSALVWVNVFEANTETPVTVSFNDGPVLTIKSNSGENVEVGGLQAGMILLGIASGSTFRLFSDEAIAAKLYAARDVAVAARIAAEAARDIAAGYASDAVSQGNVPIYATAAGMGAITVPSGINSLRVNGYYAPGDGGEALYVFSVSEPSHAGKFQTADGRWWVIVRETLMRFEQFGALPLVDEADTTDSYAECQAAVDFMVFRGGGTLNCGAAQFGLSQSLKVRGLIANPADSGNDIHFQKYTPVSLESSAVGGFKALAAMDGMVHIVFNSDVDAKAPQYCKIFRLRLDGNNLAQFGIRSEFGFHETFEFNVIDNVLDTGIRTSGRGEHLITRNTIRAPICIQAEDGGGDSWYTMNDLFPSATGIRLGTSSGNAVVEGNVINREGTGTIIGVDIDATETTTTQVYAIRVENNEFFGISTCVRGYTNAGNTGLGIHNTVVKGNHNRAQGTTFSAGRLVEFVRVQNFWIVDNAINQTSSTDIDTALIYCQDCSDGFISENRGVNCNFSFADLNGCTDIAVSENRIRNVAKAGTSTPIIRVRGPSGRIDIVENRAWQTSGTYGQTLVREEDTPNFTKVAGNRLTGITALAALVGANSWFIEHGDRSARSSGRGEWGTFSTTGVTAGRRIGRSDENGLMDSSREGTASLVHQRFYNPNGQVGSISTSASSTAFATSSDERLKDFHGNYDPIKAVELIRALPVREFAWKSSGQHSIGWGAQTLGEKISEARVLGHGEPGNDDFTPEGVDQSKLVPYLWAAISALLDRMEAMEERL